MSRTSMRSLPLAMIVLVSALIGLAAGVVAAHSISDYPTTEGARYPASDRVTEAVESLRDDPFYVAPELRRHFTETQHAAITDALRAGDATAYLIFMTDGTDGGTYLGGDLIDRLAAELGDGSYHLVDERMARTTKDFGQRYWLPSDNGLQARPADGLLAYAKELSNLEKRDDDDQLNDYWGGPGGGFAAGLLFAAGASIVIGLLWLVVRAFRRRS